MGRQSRHDAILRAAAESREVSVSALAQRLDVSVMTIRRDLAQLSRAGKLNRTHGGAVVSRAGVVAFDFGERENRQAAQKNAIARAIAAHISPGMAVSLDTGTTTLEVARCLRGMGRLTVLTSSLAVASVLHTDADIEVMLLGGRVRTESPDMDGPLAEDNLRRFHSHLAVLAADAVSPQGIFVDTVGISRISQAIMAGADRKILAVDSSKFTRGAFVRYAGVEDMDAVVTDDGAAPETRAWLAERAREVTYVSADERRHKTQRRR